MPWSRQRYSPIQPDVLLLDASAPVPGGTAPGAILFVKTAQGVLARSVPVILIENGATVDPTTTPTNTVVLEKA